MTAVRIVDLHVQADPRGAVVVIDVLRAFTTAAVAFARGAAEIVPVTTVEDAFRARRTDPAVLLMGESDGHPIEGFDLGNSPVEIAAADVAGCRLVQRTTSGTQGIVGNLAAAHVLAASFACAAATVATVKSLDPDVVTFVVTGSRSADRGEEDRACAEYLAALLHGEAPDAGAFLDRARGSAAAQRFAPGGDLAAMGADLEACLRLDIADLAIRLRSAGDRAVLRPLRGSVAAP